MSNCLKALQSDRSRQKLEVGRHVEGRRGTGRVSPLVALHLMPASVSAGGGRTAGRTRSPTGSRNQRWNSGQTETLEGKGRNLQKERATGARESLSVSSARTSD